MGTEMTIMKFSAAESALLMQLAIEQCALACIDVRKESFGPAGREVFLRWCRIVSELHEPTPSFSEAYGPQEERAANHLGIDMVEMVSREGIDINKELGPYDPRASRPRCAHGKFFDEDCQPCASVVIRPDSEVNPAPAGELTQCDGPDSYE